MKDANRELRISIEDLRRDLEMDERRRAEEARRLNQKVLDDVKKDGFVVDFYV